MVPSRPCLTTGFMAAMRGLGPFEPRPVLGVAVSGGADSMALAILARDWALRCDGSIHALVVDHGLRPASADEARITMVRLTRHGIPAQLLRLADLRHGPALAERARTMRYKVLHEACRQKGLLHLLLGHHAADQVETLAMRVLRGSQTHGLAAMAALVETAGLRLLRPLLGIDPAQIRNFLVANGVEWVEDPSNRDMRATRPRLRHHLAGHASDDTGLLRAMAAVGRMRSGEEAALARELACRAEIRPEGFALLAPGRIGAAALSSLIRAIGGALYAPSAAKILELAAKPRPATVAGVRMMTMGRFGDAILMVREEASIMEPVEARIGMVWDNRFRLIGRRPLPAGATIGKLGTDAAQFRSVSDLPSTVLRTLPAVRFGGSVAAVPHLSYAANGSEMGMTFLFTPPRPVAGACFAPAG